MVGTAGVAIAAGLGLGIYAFVTGGSPANLAQPPAQGGRATGPLCRASQLSATTFMEGATGSMVGEATLTSVGGATCSLPAVSPSVHIVWQRRVLPAREVVGMAPSSLMRPVHVLAPGAKASVYMQWREWCGYPPETTTIQPVFRLQFPGVAVDAPAQPMSTPRCDASGTGTAGSTISVSHLLTNF